MGRDSDAACLSGAGEFRRYSSGGWLSAKGYDLESLPWSYARMIAGEANRLICRPPDEALLAQALVPNRFDDR